MRKEVKIWRIVNNHPNIVTFIDAGIHKTSEGNYLYILSEYCDEGHLLDLLESYNGALSENQILLAISHVVSGIRHMHSQNPPIAHRDIKVENVLLKNKKFKLCDFGSASEEYLNPSTESADVIDDAFERYEKYTTFMYRPPEMLDRFSKWEISTKVDSWMLGCVLFALCYFKHPFQDAQKLAIINAHYFFPTDKNSNERISEKMRDFIMHILTPNPSNRPSMEEIEEIIGNWESIDKIILNPDAQKIKQEYYRRIKGVSSKPKVQIKPAGDLTLDEINRIQEKIRKQEEAKKQKVFVPFYENYEAKMEEDLYNKKPKVSKPQSKSNPRTRHQPEGQNSSFNEQPEQNSKNFWTEFPENNKQEKPKKSKSTKDTQEADFSWNFGTQTEETNVKKNQSNQKKDEFDFDFGSSTQEKSKEDDWFNFNGSDAAQKQGKKQSQISEGIQTDDDFFAPIKQKPANDEFDFFGESKPAAPTKNNQFDFDKNDSDDDFQFDSNSRKVQQKDDLLFESKEQDDDDSEFLFGGHGDKEKKYNDIIENSKKTNKSEFVMNEYFGSSENDVKVDSGSSEHIMNKINQLYSDSGIPVSSNKTDDILKPQMPKVLAEHEKKQKEFVPEVKQTGQNFWENLYTNQSFSQQNFQPNANIPKNTNFSASLKSKDVPANFESKYSTLNNITLTSKKESFGKKEKESGKFKDLGIDYLLQTNIK